MPLFIPSERSAAAVRSTLVILATLLFSQAAAGQSLSYSRGQNISPGYEGWEEDADGSRGFVFGDMNRNWEEEPDILVGPDNEMRPGGPDLGQPTHFLPRRNRFVFRAPALDDFGADDELVWTLTVNGVTERAYATLPTGLLHRCHDTRVRVWCHRGRYNQPNDPGEPGANVERGGRSDSCGTCG